MAIPADLGLEPVPIRKYGSDAIFQKKKRTGGDKKVVYYFYGEFDLTKFLESDLETPVNPNANLTLCFKRQKEGPPISELFIYVAQRQNKEVAFELPNDTKYLQYRLGQP